MPLITRYTFKSKEPNPALKAFEEALMRPVVGFRQVKVPRSAGTGTLTAIQLKEGLSMTLEYYVLNAPMELTKESVGEPSDVICIAFYDLRVPEAAIVSGNLVVYREGGVNVYTEDTDLSLSLRLPANTERNVVVVRIARPLLESMLGDPQGLFLDELLQRRGSYFISERLSAEMRSAMNELKAPPAPKALGKLFYNMKCLQLLYLLMEQLNKRAAIPIRPINPDHIGKVLKARSLLIQDLSAPPTIAELAKETLMSESQLKQLFREVFGASIYQYFQNSRMEKARQLLADRKMTVKEAGYALGFTNVGHFARLFERAYHVKPKKFQMGVEEGI